MSIPSELRTQAEEAALRRAVARGYLGMAQLDEARRLAAAQGEGAPADSILKVVASRYLDPEQRAEIREVFEHVLHAGTPGSGVHRRPGGGGSDEDARPTRRLGADVEGSLGDATPPPSARSEPAGAGEDVKPTRRLGTGRAPDISAEFLESTTEDITSTQRMPSLETSGVTSYSPPPPPGRPRTTLRFTEALPIPQEPLPAPTPAPPAPPASDSGRSALLATSAADSGRSAPPWSSSPRASSPAGLGRVGEYELVRELARGGMGVVYVARQPGLEREVALKRMLAGKGARPDQLERFAVEARTAARLRHPNIVGIHHVGDDGGRPYLVMDLLPGGSLKARLAREGPLPPREAARLAEILAGALAYAHQRSVLHRDLKPDNVLLDDEGQPVLTDFGLAKDVRAEGITVTGQLLGTPAYMAPEQAAGEVERVDRRADVYALGATLFELLVGQAPFGGDSVLNVIASVLRSDPPRPSSLRPTIDRDLETICLKCLEKEPEQRYGTAGELREDLARYLAHQPILARPPGLAERARKWVRRNPVLARVVAGAAVLVLLVSIAGVVGVSRTRAQLALRQAEAAERERSELAAAAQAACAEAFAALAGAALPTDAADSLARREALGRRSARALAAYVAAQRWHGLDPAGEATEALFRAAIALGEVNQAGEQWLLAAQAYAEAAELGVDDARARALLEGVEAGRTARRRARLERINQVLARAERGELLRRKGDLEGAVFQLVHHVNAEVLPTLLARLDGITKLLRAAELSLYRRALAESDDGLRITSDELGEALDARHAAWAAGETPRDEAPPAGEAGRVARALWALDRRLLEAHRDALRGANVRRRATVGGAIARAQAAELGDSAAVAQLLCRALGQLRAYQESVETLTRYLSWESDPQRARWAGVALCFLGGERALACVNAARFRFGLDGVFAAEVSGLLGLVEDDAELGEESPQAYSRRAEARRAQGDLPKALADVERAIALDPENPDWLVQRSLVHRDQGRLQAAVEDCTQALRLRPTHGFALINRASALRQLGQLDRALADVNAALDQGGRGQPLAWVHRAAIRFSQGDVAGAIADYGRALEVDPESVDALVNRGVAYLKQGQPARALADAERALELSPRNLTAWMLKGDLRRRAEDPEGAAACYAEGIELAPEHPHIWLKRAEVRLDQGERQGALADLSRALELRPDYPRALDLRAGLLLETRRLPAARTDLERLVALEPGIAPHWDKLGAVRAMLGAEEEALAAHTRAVELEPAGGQYRFNRGSALHGLGRLDEALADYEAALRLDPRLPGAWANRGLIRARRGELEGAIKDLQRSLELAPDHPLADRTRGVLRELEQRQRAEK